SIEGQWQLRNFTRDFIHDIREAMTAYARNTIRAWRSPLGCLDPEDVAQDVLEGLYSARIPWNPLDASNPIADAGKSRLLPFLWDRVLDTIRNRSRQAWYFSRVPI